jgi:hypothetical protein
MIESRRIELGIFNPPNQIERKIAEAKDIRIEEYDAMGTRGRRIICGG